MSTVEAPKLARLGLFAAASIVVANMIGTGVFTSAGYQAAGLHDPTTMMLTWVVGGIIARCGAAAYAELGAMMPKAGGEYVYLREAYHPAVGAMSGWASLTAGFSAPIAASAMLFAKYLAKVFPTIDHDASKMWIAIALVVAMSCLHGFDTVIGGRVQAVFTAAKTALIVVFSGAGLLVGHGSWSHFASVSGGTSNVWTTSFAISLMYVSFAYSGWNAAAYIAGDIRDPRRNVPRALLLGTGLVMVLYILLNLVFIYAVPPDVLAGAGSSTGPIAEVGDAAARALFGNAAGNLISTLIALALVSAVSAMVMAGPRVYSAMADDHALPNQLAWRSKRGVPLVAVALQGVLAIVMIVFLPFDSVIRYVGATLSIFAGLTVAAVPILRRRLPNAERPYRTFGYPITPILFIGLSAWIAYSQFRASWQQSLAVLATMVGGVIAYALIENRRRSHRV